MKRVMGSAREKTMGSAREKTMRNAVKRIMGNVTRSMTRSVMKRITKSMMKAVCFCLLSACVLAFAIPSAAVRADVLIELKDSFWEKHYTECESVYREYTVNAPDGYAVLRESPLSSKETEVLANGTKVWSNWRYTDDDGEVWCVIQGDLDRVTGKESVRGWIKTSDCLVTPDHISFREAYGEEFVGYDPAYDQAFDEIESVKLWSYPCSGVVKADRIDVAWFRDGATPADIFDTCWRDPVGRLWAFVGYCYGIRNTWICLDDPAGVGLEEKSEIVAEENSGTGAANNSGTGDNSSIGTEDNSGTDSAGNPGTGTGAGGTPAAMPEILPQDAVIYPPAEKLPAAKNGVTGYVVGGVLGVVAATAGLIWFFFGRKRPGAE